MLVAIPLAVLVIVFVEAGGIAFALFVIAIGWLCMYELYRMLDRWKPLPIVGFAALAGMVLAGVYGGQRQVAEVAMATLPVLFLLTVARGERHPTSRSQGRCSASTGSGSRSLTPRCCASSRTATRVLIDVLIGTFVGDTGAYLGGRLFGRRPLAPSISPNKTVEGLVCGMLGRCVAVFLAGLYQTWLTQGDALLLGIAVAVLGPLGDLFESVVKRDAGVKDAGTLFGAHGGALDRLDAALFTVVVGYYVWLAVCPLSASRPGPSDLTPAYNRACRAASRSSAPPARSASRPSTSSRAPARSSRSSR